MSLCHVLTTLKLLHEMFQGNLQMASTYHAVACRCVFSLGGHTTVPASLSTEHPTNAHERETHQIRTIFWLCYAFDKDVVLRMGQPPIICDQFCDLTLPDGYREGRFAERDETLSSPNDRRRRMPWFPSDLHLCMIKAKVGDALYSTVAIKMSDAVLLRTIRELDAELESWRVSVKYSPELSIPRDFRLADDLDKAQSMVSIDLHMSYHYVLNIIHCASGRRKSDLSCTGGNEGTFGLQSSLDLSVAASRSTLMYLRAAKHRLAPEAFW